jgi:hypothetical protein
MFIETPSPFKSPLNSQRYFAAVAKMHTIRPSFVVDIGCSACDFLFYLSLHPNYLQFAVGLDKNLSALTQGHRNLTAPSIVPRCSRDFSVSLFHEDITQLSPGFIEQFEFAPFVTMIEVIEHLTVEELEAPMTSVFGSLQPLHVFITTPNIEYNEVLTKVFSKTAESGKFRHSDHKFEWTRQEFQVWCEGISSRYGYSSLMSGIG